MRQTLSHIAVALLLWGVTAGHCHHCPGGNPSLDPPMTDICCTQGPTLKTTPSRHLPPVGLFFILDPAPASPVEPKAGSLGEYDLPPPGSVPIFLLNQAFLC